MFFQVELFHLWKVKGEGGQSIKYNAFCKPDVPKGFSGVPAKETSWSTSAVEKVFKAKAG